MKSEKNVVYDIIVASGLTIDREKINGESIRILREYGQEKYNLGSEDGYQDGSLWGGF